MQRTGVEYLRDYLNNDSTSDLILHLTDNHYPPLPITFVGVCQAAIRACNHGEWEKSIRLPDDLLWKGSHYAPAREIVETYHLDGFLGDDI